MGDKPGFASRSLRQASVAARSVRRTARRPGTYPAIARESLMAGINLALMPVGVVRDTLKVEDAFRLSERYTPGTALQYLDPEAAATPVILLHGYFHNRSAFVVMRRALRKTGFRTVDTLNYNPFLHGVPELAEQLAAHVDEVLGACEAHQVHLVGHSLGGLVARYYIQMLGGSEKVSHCVTLGTPHQGTYAAYIGRGRAARQIRPGAPLIKLLNRPGGTPVTTRFSAFYSNLDGMILPASNAKLTRPGLDATNLLVRDLGHQSLLVSKSVTRRVAERLTLPTGGEELAQVRALEA
jgi:triacylglycerol lipase